MSSTIHIKVTIKDEDDTPHNGWHTVSLNAIDMGTLGTLDIAINAADAGKVAPEELLEVVL